MITSILLNAVRPFQTIFNNVYLHQHLNTKMMSHYLRLKPYKMPTTVKPQKLNDLTLVSPQTIHDLLTASKNLIEQVTKCGANYYLTPTNCLNSFAEMVAKIEGKKDTLLKNKPYENVAVIWCIEDVLSVCPRLSKEQASEVLKELTNQHNAELGINWDVIECVCDNLYPNEIVEIGSTNN